MPPTEAYASTTHPDLLPLLEQGREGVERCACIVLAMLGGATWSDEGAGGSMLWRGELPAAFHSADGLDPYHLPNPLADTEAGRAAAWELETRELNGWIEMNGLHRFRFYVWPNHGVGPWHPDRHRAAVLAVLKKYADGYLSHLIHPLLDKMTEEPV